MIESSTIVVTAGTCGRAGVTIDYLTSVTTCGAGVTNCCPPT